jgi:hypothetical protein
VPEVPKSCAATTAPLAAQRPKAVLNAKCFIKTVSILGPVYPKPQAQANQGFAMFQAAG